MTSLIKSQKWLQQKESVEQLTKQYETVLTNNYQRQENTLLQQLSDYAKELKREIAQYKKAVSQDNLDNLIADRRREKEKERQGLETRWRQCNAAYKKLQEEQKRLTNEHKQNLFDVSNLQNKIREFQNQLDRKCAHTADQQGHHADRFITQTHAFQRKPRDKEKVSKQEQQFRTLASEFSNVSRENLMQQLEKRGCKSKPIMKHTLSVNSNNSQCLWKGKKAEMNATGKTNKKQSISVRGTFCKNSELLTFLMSPHIKAKIFQVLNREL